MRWVEFIGPEGQKGSLSPYVNLWDHDLLQQWNTQINIHTVPQTHVSGKDIRKYYKHRSTVIQAVQEHKAISKPSEVLTALAFKIVN